MLIVQCTKSQKSRPLGGNLHSYWGHHTLALGEPRNHILFSHRPGLPFNCFLLVNCSLGAPPYFRWRALTPALDRSLARNPRSSPIVSPSWEPCSAIMTDADTPTHTRASLAATPSLPTSHWLDQLMTEY